MTTKDNGQAALWDEAAAATAERDMTMRAVWAAIEGRLEFTLDWLEMITNSLAEDLIQYLSLLASNGYVEICGIRRAGSGEVIPLFRQRIRHGSRPPWWDYDQKRLVDPNKPDASNSVRRQGLPSMSARLRFAAETLGNFTRDELQDAVCGDVRDRVASERFGYSWNSLRGLGQIRPAGERYEYVPDQEIHAIREFMRSSLGRALTGREVWQAVGETVIRGARIREAADLLAAEGYQVTIDGQRPGRKVRYLIERG